MWKLIPSSDWIYTKFLVDYRTIEYANKRNGRVELARWNSEWRTAYGNTEIFINDEKMLRNFRTLATLCYGAEFKSSYLDGKKLNDVFTFESFETVKECCLKFEELCSSKEKPE